MPRLYFHLHDGSDVILDPEGTDLPLERMEAQALLEARALIADEARAGRIDLRQRIDVEDGNGKIMWTLRFVDAVEMVGLR